MPYLKSRRGNEPIGSPGGRYPVQYVTKTPAECVKCFQEKPKARRTRNGFDCFCPACGHRWFEEWPDLHLFSDQPR